MTQKNFSYNPIFRAHFWDEKTRAELPTYIYVVGPTGDVQNWRIYTSLVVKELIYCWASAHFVDLCPCVTLSTACQKYRIWAILVCSVGACRDLITTEYFKDRPSKWYCACAKRSFLFFNRDYTNLIKYALLINVYRIIIIMTADL